MNGRSNKNCDRKTQRAFLLWSWAMLLVILLSAAPTTAQPRSRIVGSAFDPSTTCVAISPNKLKFDSCSGKRIRSNPGEGSVGTSTELFVIAENTAAQPPRSSDTCSLFEASTNFAGSAREPGRWHTARAPPLVYRRSA
jgi:hypothetical protein